MHDGGIESHQWLLLHVQVHGSIRLDLTVRMVAKKPAGVALKLNLENPLHTSGKAHKWRIHITDDKTNRQSSACMSLSTTYFTVPLVAVRLNYKSVTKSCVLTDHSPLFISDEQFLSLIFPKCNLDICTVLFLSALDSILFIYKYLVTCDLLRVTKHHCC